VSEMSDFIIDGKQVHKTLRITSIKKKSIKKHCGLFRKNADCFELEDMLDIVNLVNKGLNGEKLPKVNNSRVLSCAERILYLSSNPETRERAESMIRKLNHKIVVENRRASNQKEGKRLYDDLMKG
jgi:hypothetical protein